MLIATAVLGGWLILAAAAAAFFAAVGRGALREDEALGHLPSARPPASSPGPAPAPVDHEAVH